jgi:16S rRNA (uracil1498-N3)-methyltransferase
MSRYDFRTPRVFIDAPLAQGGTVAFDRDQSNYLANVMRLKDGDAVLLFNGRDGEWRAHLQLAGKRALSALLDTQLRPQPPAGDLRFLFAPLKHARLDYLVQKAVEMGASCLQPLLTQHTQVSRINLDRMRANAIEAAEQCGVLALPSVGEPVPFSHVIDPGQAERLVIFCDEDAEVKDPVVALQGARSAKKNAAIDVLIGPEGGFSDDERAALIKRPSTLRLSLGPRILRADTAAVAALALVQAVLGDWQSAI